MEIIVKEFLYIRCLNVIKYVNKLLDQSKGHSVKKIKCKEMQTLCLLCQQLKGFSISVKPPSCNILPQYLYIHNMRNGITF